MRSNGIYLPYFYIIKHIPSNRKYAGSRWARGCNPSELLKPNGYKTSSKSIRDLIRSDGIESFEIVLITDINEISLLGYSSVLEYETKFLKENDCKNSDEWINIHDNSSAKNFHYPDGSNAMENKEICYKAVNGRISTMLQRYGVTNHTQIPELKQKQQKRTEETIKSKYGVDNIFQLVETKNKIKSSMKQKYGVDNIQQTPENKKKRSEQNNCLVCCCFCKKEVIYASYISSHGYYCDQNDQNLFVSDVESGKTYKKRTACCLKSFREIKHLFW